MAPDSTTIDIQQTRAQLLAAESGVLLRLSRELCKCVRMLRRSVERGEADPTRVKQREQSHEAGGQLSDPGAEDEALQWVFQERLRLIEAWRALEAEQRQIALTSTKSGQQNAASPVTAAPKPVVRTKAAGRSQPMAGAQQFRMLQRELDRNRD